MLVLAMRSHTNEQLSPYRRHAWACDAAAHDIERSLYKHGLAACPLIVILSRHESINLLNVHLLFRLIAEKV